MAVDLVSLQHDAESEMTGAANVIRPVSTRTAGGGISKTWSTVYTNIPCLAGPTQYPAWERDVEDKVGGRSYWMFTCPVRYNINSEDRIETSGRVFEVTSEQSPRSIGILNRVLIVEVT